MKKKIVMGMLLSLCMLTLAGCDKNASSGKTESQSETTGTALDESGGDEAKNNDANT